MTRALDKRDLKRRHPLCPACRYDLIATIARNGRICPECGYAFELSELVSETRPGDWTPLRGLRMATVALGARAILALVAAVLLSLAVIWLVRSPLPFILAFFIGLIEAGVVGSILSRRLIERAGFDSILLTLAACLSAMMVASAGWWLATVLAQQAPMVGVFHVLVVTIGASAWIIHALVMDSV